MSSAAVAPSKMDTKVLVVTTQGDELLIQQDAGVPDEVIFTPAWGEVDDLMEDWQQGKTRIVVAIAREMGDDDHSEILTGEFGILISASRKGTKAVPITRDVNPYVSYPEEGDEEPSVTSWYRLEVDSWVTVPHLVEGDVLGSLQYQGLAEYPQGDDEFGSIVNNTIFENAKRLYDLVDNLVEQQSKIDDEVDATLENNAQGEMERRVFGGKTMKQVGRITRAIRYLKSYFDEHGLNGANPAGYLRQNETLWRMLDTPQDTPMKAVDVFYKVHTQMQKNKLLNRT